MAAKGDCQVVGRVGGREQYLATAFGQCHRHRGGNRRLPHAPLPIVKMTPRPNPANSSTDADLSFSVPSQSSSVRSQIASAVGGVAPMRRKASTPHEICRRRATPWCKAVPAATGELGHRLAFPVFPSTSDWIDVVPLTDHAIDDQMLIENPQLSQFLTGAGRFEQSGSIESRHEQ